MTKFKQVIRLLGLVAILGTSGWVMVASWRSIPSLGEQVDRVVPASLEHSILGSLVALDELKIQPASLVLHEAVQNIPFDLTDSIAAVKTNAELIDPKTAAAVFQQHQIPTGMPKMPAMKFDPVRMDYEGQFADGRVLSVQVRVDPANQAQTHIVVLINQGDADGALSRTVLDRIGARVKDRAAPSPAAVPPASKSALE